LALSVALSIGYNWVQADFLDITSLRLTSSNGIIEDARTRYFTFNAPRGQVPEPATLTLLFAGLAPIAFSRKDRRIT
jgi:hypothetical protein